MISVTLSGPHVLLKPRKFLGGDRFDAYRQACAGARFDREQHCNVTVPTKLPAILAALREAGFELDVHPDVKATLGALEGTFLAARAGALQATEAVAERLRERGLALYPFQRTGAEWLAGRYSALLGDDMGTGKTIQTLAAIPPGAPALVVCPALAKGVWRREAERWRPDLRTTVLSGEGSFHWPRPGELLVTNYDVLEEAFILNGCPAGLTLVADEVHAVKNRTSKRGTRFRVLAAAVQRSGGRLWGLTATPLLNSPEELWGLLSALGLTSEAFGRWERFTEVFGGKKAHFGGWVWANEPRIDPKPLLARVMLRRLKSEVLPELPPKTWREVDVEVRGVKRALDKAWESLAPTYDVDEVAFDRISETRKALAAAKIPPLLELATEYERAGAPLVVFSAHRAPVDAFWDREGWRIIVGDTPPKNRQEIAEAMQRGDLRGVAATIQAGGTALTMTRAKDVVFVDRLWTPALNEQAEDRVYRIGQDRGVMVTDLVADHPLDRRVHEVLTRKRRLIEATV